AGRGEPELIRGDRGVREAATAEVVEGRLDGLRAGQTRVREADRRLHHAPQAGPARVLAGRPLVELHAGLGGQDLEGLRERQAVALHHEVEDVAALATAEALPPAACGSDRERGGLLAVEGAEALVRRAGLLQLDRLAHRSATPRLAFVLGAQATAQT